MARPRTRKFSADVREKSEYDQKVLDIRRTARVVAGGRRFSFRATVAIGNRNGKIGLGTGKGNDVTTAIEKAVHRAKKHVVQISLDDRKTISHTVEAKFSAAKVILRPSAEGRGLVAGGPIRVIANLAGIKNLTAKILGRTPNKLNNAAAAMAALRQLGVKSKKSFSPPSVRQETPKEEGPSVEKEPSSEAV